MIQRKHTLDFDTINFPPNMAQLFFRLINQISIQTSYIATSVSTVLDESNHYEHYDITLTFAILILRGDKRTYYVVEPVDSNFLYSDEINKDKSLQFSFLKVYHCLGELEVKNGAFKFLSYEIPHFHFICEGIINPKQATIAQRLFLHDLFTTIYREKIRDKKYGISRIENGYLKDYKQLLKLENKEGRVSIDIDLKFAVSLRDSLHYLKEYRADVLEHGLIRGKDELRKGSFARVSSISGTFKRSGFFPKTSNKKVLKDYIIPLSNKLKKLVDKRLYADPVRLIKTVKLSNLTDHLKSSPPIAYVIHDGGEHEQKSDKGVEHWQLRETDFLLTDEETELFDYMRENPLYFEREDGSGPVVANQKITIDDVLELFYETALALERFHFKNLVHKDIKPENLIIKKTTKKCSVFDLNFSKEAAENDEGKTEGTPDYVSPEQFKGEGSGFKSDVFSLLRAWLLWFGDGMPGGYQASSPNAFIPGFPYLIWLVFENQISIEHSDLLINMFNRGFEFDYDKRSDLEYLLTTLDKIILSRRRERAQEKLSPELMINFNLAQIYAIEIRAMFMIRTKITNLGTKNETYCPTRIIDMSEYSLGNLKSGIIAKLNKLEDNVIIMREFCQLSRIEAIRNLEKREVIQASIENIFDSYIKELKKLTLLFNSSLDKDEKKEIQSLLDLRDKYSFNLENIIKLTNIFSKFHEKKYKNNLKQKQESTGLLKDHLLLFSLESKKKLNNSLSFYDKMVKFLSKS